MLSPRPSHLSPALVRVASPLLFGLAWELAARRLDSLLIPGCLETLRELTRLASTRELWQALWLSNQAMILGFALAVVVGVPLGLWMGRSRTAERFLNPYLSILIAIPKSALIPVVIMATGLGLLSRVLVTFSFSLVSITVNTRAGLRLIEPAWLEMARSFGASEGQIWRKILVRGSLPALLTGLRLGAARAITGMITVELLLVAVGIGRLMLDFEGTFNSAGLYATVLVIVAEAVLMLQAFRWLERRIVPWATREANR